MASTKVGSAVCFSTENWLWRSLMPDTRWDGGALSASLFLADCRPQIHYVLTPADVTPVYRRENAYRGLMTNGGERSGWVVTTPIGITGALSSSSIRKVPISLASASVASTNAKCAPM